MAAGVQKTSKCEKVFQRRVKTTRLMPVSSVDTGGSAAGGSACRTNGKIVAAKGWMV